MSQATVTPLGASSWGTRKVSFSLDACRDRVPLLQCLSGVRDRGAGGAQTVTVKGQGPPHPEGTPVIEEGWCQLAGVRGERSDLRPSKSHWLAASGREDQTGRQDLNPRGLRIRVGLPWSLGGRREDSRMSSRGRAASVHFAATLAEGSLPAGLS